MPVSRPRALLITRNLPPLRGGMERLVQHLAGALVDRYPLAERARRLAIALDPEWAARRYRTAAGVGVGSRRGRR